MIRLILGLPLFLVWSVWADVPVCILNSLGSSICEGDQRILAQSPDDLFHFQIVSVKKIVSSEDVVVVLPKGFIERIPAYFLFRPVKSLFPERLERGRRVLPIEDMFGPSILDPHLILDVYENGEMLVQNLAGQRLFYNASEVHTEVPAHNHIKIGMYIRLSESLRPGVVLGVFANGQAWVRLGPYHHQLISTRDIEVFIEEIRGQKEGRIKPPFKKKILSALKREVISVSEDL